LKTKALKNKKVNIITLGCSKNLVDSENLLTQLKGNGIDAHHEVQDKSDIVVVNTCGFIDLAKQESIDTILSYADAKNEGEIEKLYVTGCLSERYKQNLENEIPEVDAFFGTRDLPQLLNRFEADYKHELIGERLSTTPQHYAYLKIAEGCDRPCSFCAIPIMRGKHQSKSIEDLVLETKALVKKGTKEILLIAQDLTYYGLDLYKKRNLAELLKQLSDIEGLEWIRLHYAYPAGFPMDVLDVMKERANICNYLDMPLQHGSSNILKLMRRGIDREKTEKLITEIRTKIPDITLRTTLIAGHPGETDEDFEEMKTFVEDMKFDRLGVFAYSHEDGTHSGTMDDNVSDEVKQARVDEIMAIQEEISFQKNQQKVGNTYKVLFDRKEGDYFIGRTESDSPDVDNEVLVNANKYYIRIGDFAMVEIYEADSFDLHGFPITE